MCSTHSTLLYCTQREGRNKQRVSDLQDCLQGMLLEAGLQSIWRVSVKHVSCLPLPAGCSGDASGGCCVSQMQFNQTKDTTGRAETHEGVVLATMHSPSSTPLCSERADLLRPQP